MAVVLPAALRDQLVAWSAAEHPREACGLLIGTRVAGEWRVRRVLPAANIAPAPRTRRYEVAPLDLLEADRVARASGQELVGVWHSHPGRSARPSERDRRGAYPGWAYVILGGQGELRAWHLREQALVELPLASRASPLLSAGRTP